MSSTTLYRWSGIVLLLGGLLNVVSSILDAVLFPGEDTTAQQILSAPWLIGAILFFVGMLLIVMGFPGAYLRQAVRAGRPGFAGFAVLWLGMLLAGPSFAAVRLTIYPYLAQEAPKLLPSNGSGPDTLGLLLLLLPALLLTVGGILLGIATIRAGVFSRWVGILFLGMGILSGVSFIVPPSSIGDILQSVRDLALFVAFAWFGYALVAQRVETVAGSSLVTPTVQTSR